MGRPARRSVVDALDRPTAPLDVHQHRPAVGQLELESGPAPMALRIPPALVDRPRAGPGHDVAPACPDRSRSSPAHRSRWPLPLTPSTAPSDPRTSTGGDSDRHQSRGGNRHPARPGRLGPRGGAARSAARSTAAAGTRATRSPGPRPPRSSGTDTASAPSRPWTRARARAARSSAAVSPPQKPSWRPVAGTTSSGVRVSRVTPLVGRTAAGPLSHPSSCQRTRSARAPALSAPS